MDGQNSPYARAIVPPALPSTATRYAGRSSSTGSATNASQTPPVSTVSGRQSECTATPSFRYSRRAPSRSTTCTNWYGDSTSYKTSPSLAFTAPGGTSTSAAIAAVATSQRRPSIVDAAAASSAAVTSSVRCVPISGIVMSAGTNVPSRLPTVETA